MKIIAFTLLMFGLLSGSGCSKRCEDKDRVQLKYAQTQCADPWGRSGTDNGTVQNLQRYFDSLAIPVADLSIQNDGIAEICSSCTCLTGKNIYLKSSIANTQRLEAIGFIRTD